MTVKELVDRFGYEVVCMPEPGREVTGGYAGDLLSWVMGRAESGDAWVTIMSNLNVVAVATLADVSCVILAEGVTPDEGVAEIAEAKGINILSSNESAYGIAKRLCEVGV